MQTKKQSLFEAITNTAVGFIISLIASFIIFPMVGIHTTPLQNLGVTIFYTIISIIRSYVIRRWFNRAKLVTYPNKEPFLVHCFECEFEMPIKEKDGSVWCSNCGLIHK